MTALSPSTEKMNESARVETTSRLAQWRIENLSSCSFRKSHPFRIGLWNWHLSVEKNKQIIIRLFPEASSFAKERPPIASFVIRVICFTGRRRHILHPEVRDKQLKSSDDFSWAIEPGLSGKVTIEVDFMDLKAGSVAGPSWAWAGDQLPPIAKGAALSALGQMLVDGATTDVTINTADGVSNAHRAILAARSPVFRSMFSHDLKEKELATVDIADMSAASCSVFLRYLYGGDVAGEFLAHRLPLLRAADKYDVGDLRRACEDSLTEDVDGDNVLERLQIAHLYRLPLLKNACMRYLVEFERIWDLQEEVAAFLLIADRELVADVFREVLAAWKAG
ncbi:BTB/POZ domain-containing protein At1g55760-like [Wolffia australiana]